MAAMVYVQLTHKRFFCAGRSCR